jgi:Tol biopolymer transport system component
VLLKVVDKRAEFPLTAGGSMAAGPVLSFSCGKVAYRQRMAERGEVLMIMDANGANKRELPVEGTVEEIVFSPDGRWLYCSAALGRDEDADIVRIRPEGHTLQRIVAWKGSSEDDIAFSADSQLMAFSSDREGERHVYLSNINGEEPLRITELPANHFAPAFSPDGASVAYLCDRTGFDERADLWIYDRKRGKQFQLTRNAHVAEFCWLNDSRTILYSSGVNMRDFNTINLDTGENRKFIVTDGIKTYSEVAPRRITYREEHKVIYTRVYDNGEKQIYWVNPDGTGDQRLVNSGGNDWLAE